MLLDKIRITYRWMWKCFHWS